MRGGGCSVQQSLTAEAVAIVKQALSLARRRGNAQVTPLHVASAMLASPTALLRSACRHSNSHPLQCKALELCFNVALNRLPTSTSGSLFTPTTTSHHPSLSNALVAALKRAQAHQRRGSLDTQQQPVLTLKIEVEQLLLSILDDPSVSRVMREAGFTSTQVKEKVEQAVSLQICSKTLSMAAAAPPPPDCKLKSQASPPPLPVVYQGKAARDSEEEDVGRVMEAVVTQKRRNTVVVGESVGVAERVVKKVMGKIEVGQALALEMRGLQFISLPLFTLKGMSEERVEVKIVELRCLVRSCFNRGTTVFYLGDLQWVSEFLSFKEDCGYCPVRHMMMELRRIACGNIKGERICLIAVATYKTFMNCKTTHPSLHSLLELHPLTISSTTPATTSTCLDLSLNLHSGTQARIRRCKAKNGEEEEEEEEWWRVLSGNLVKEEGKKPVLSSSSSRKRVNESSLSANTGTPLWFRCRHESQSLNLKGEYEEERVGGDVCKKPSSSDCGWAHNLSSSFHDRVLPFLKTSSSPSSISSISIPSSGDPLLPNLIHTLIGWPVSLPRQQRLPPKEHQFWKWEKPELLSNPNSSPNSASSSEAATPQEEVEVEEEETFLGDFKEVKAETLGLLIRALEKKVPWQKKGVVYEIASTVVRCRSGTRQGDGRLCTWLFFRGVDCSGKYAVAKELGRLVFGSTVSPVVIGRPSCMEEDSGEGVVGGSRKRWREEEEEGSSCCGYFNRFAAAVGDNPHRVFFMEGVEEADRASMVGIKRAMETGRVGGGVVSLQDAIVIFSCENSITSSSPSSSPPPPLLTNAGKKQRTGGGMGEKEEESGDSDGNVYASVSLDLNIAVEEEVEEDDDHQEQESDVDILRYVDKEIVFNSGEEDVI